MKKTIEDLFNDASIIDLEEEIDFENTDKYYDWRNYIGDFKDIWNNLTLREKKIIYIFCKQQADAEEVD